MITINYNRLYNFHILATEGSLKAASIKLSITPSTISEQIKLLEVFFENDLFTREKGRLRISAFGQQVYTYTTSIFETGDRLLQAVYPGINQLPNVLEIDTTPLIVDICPSDMFLPIADKDYTLKLNQSMFIASLKRLYTFEIDMIISEESSLIKQAMNISKVKIREIKFYCCIGSKLFNQNKDWNIDDLNEIPHIAYSHQTRTRHDTDNYFLNNEVTPVVTIETNEIKLIKDATINNLGYSFLPETLIDSCSDSISKIFEKPAFKVEIYSYTSNNHKREVIDQVIENLKK
jgi:LysR family transcriptional activator of nhaA